MENKRTLLIIRIELEKAVSRHANRIDCTTYEKLVILRGFNGPIFGETLDNRYSFVKFALGHDVGVSKVVVGDGGVDNEIDWDWGTVTMAIDQ